MVSWLALVNLPGALMNGRFKWGLQKLTNHYNSNIVSFKV